MVKLGLINIPASVPPDIAEAYRLTPLEYTPRGYEFWFRWRSLADGNCDEANKKAARHLCEQREMIRSSVEALIPSAHERFTLPVPKAYKDQPPR